MLTDIVKLENPRSLAELWAAHERLAGARVLLAGGTDLVVRAKDGGVPRGTWINLLALPELAGVAERGDDLRLGAAATWAEIQRSPLVLAIAPALAQAARGIGSPPLRARATVGGNLGNASPAADGVPALVAHDARLVLASETGHREVAAADFALAPRRTVLGDREIILEILVPRRPARRSAFAKLGPRAALAIAKVSAAVAARLDAGVLRDVRVALGAVAPTVFRASAAEALLEGARPSPTLLAEAAAAAAAAATPITDARSTAEYRRAMVAVLVRRLLEQIGG